MKRRRQWLVYTLLLVLGVAVLCGVFVLFLELVLAPVRMLLYLLVASLGDDGELSG